MRGFPIWLKAGFTLFVAVWIPVYWWYWGPSNFLWFCDVGNLVLLAALWTGSPLLFSWQAVSVLGVQVVYSLDLLCRLVAGFHPVGATAYVFDPVHPLPVRLLALFHLAVPPLLVLGLARLGYDRRAFLLQTATALLVLPVSWLFGPEADLNWTWGPFDRRQEVLAPGLYLGLVLIAYPLLIYLPSHLALRALFRTPGERSR